MRAAGAPVTWVSALGLAILAVNIALTLYHARIIRKARRYRAATARLHDDAERLVEGMQDAPTHVAIPVGGRNGKRPAVDHKEGPEP